MFEPSRRRPLTTIPANRNDPERTRQQLVAAALHLFGHRGFDGTTTRQISTRAGTNVAAIGYHFGGKDQLRMACGELVASRIGQVFQSGNIETATTLTEAEDRLLEIAGVAARFLLMEAAADDMVSFMLREIGENSPVFDMIYQSVMDPKHRELCALWAIATGTDPDSPETKISVFTFIGQVVYFRIGRQAVLRRMDWSKMDNTDAELITEIIIGNLKSSLRNCREQNK